MKISYILIVLALLPQFNYSQNITPSNDLNIVLNKKSLEDPSLQYGIEPFCFENGKLEFFQTEKSGTFISFDLVFLNTDYIKKLKFNRKDEVVKNGKNNAVINLGFYGIHPNMSYYSPNTYLLTKQLNNLDRFSVSQLLANIVVSGKLIKNIDIKDIWLVCINLNNEKNSNAKDILKEKLNVNLHSKFLYVLWDKDFLPNAPDFLNETEYSINLVSEINSKSIEIISHQDEINNNEIVVDKIASDLVIRKNIEKHFETKNIKLNDKDYEIEFPNTGDVIFLKNLNTEPKQEEPYKISLKYNNLKAMLFQSNSRSSNNFDPESDIIFNEARDYLVFDINGRNNFNDRIRIIYDKLHGTIRYPILYGEIEEIKIGFNDYKYLKTLDEIIPLNKDTIQVLVDIIKTPLSFSIIDQNENEISNDVKDLGFDIRECSSKESVETNTSENKIFGLVKHPQINYKLKLKHPDFKNEEYISILEKDFKDTVIIKSNPEIAKFKIVFKESKKFNQTIKIPEEYNFSIFKHRLPSPFQLPDSLNEIWEISSSKKKKILKKEDIGFNKEISIKRKTKNKTYLLKFSGQLPDKFRYKTFGFNLSQNRNWRDFSFKNLDSLLLLKLDSPENFFDGDSLYLLFRKPFGYNITFKNENILKNWENGILKINLLKTDTINLVFTSISPINIFYVDLSNINRRDKIIQIIEEKTVKCKGKNCLSLVFISNLNSPIITEYNDDHIKSLNAISSLNPSPPNPGSDAETLSTFINIERSPIKINFIFSESTYILSSEEIITKTLINTYNLHKKKLNGINEIIAEINKKTNEKIIVNIYGDNIKQTNMNESDKFKVIDLTEL